MNTALQPALGVPLNPSVGLGVPADYRRPVSATAGEAPSLRYTGNAPPHECPECGSSTIPFPDLPHGKCAADDHCTRFRILMAAHLVRVEAAKALEAGGTIKQVALDFGKNYDNLRKALRPLMKRREQEKREREHAIVLELELKYKQQQIAA